MLIAFSYLKTINGSLINIQCPISFKVPTRAPFTALLIILLFSNRLTKFSFNSYKFCNFQQDPVLQEDWKSTVCLGRKISRSTLGMLLSDGYCPLLGFTLHLPADIHFPSLTHFSLTLLLFFFLFSFLYSLSLHFSLSLSLLEFLTFFSFTFSTSYSLPPIPLFLEAV